MFGLWMQRIHNNYYFLTNIIKIVKKISLNYDTTLIETPIFSK